MHIFYAIMGKCVLSNLNVSIIIAFDLGILNICLPVFHLVVDSGEVSAAEVGLKYEILLSIHSYGLCSSKQKNDLNVINECNLTAVCVCGGSL